MITMLKIKKILSISIIISLVFCTFSCRRKRTNITFNSSADIDIEDDENSTIHIGIVTGSVSQSEDDRKGAEEFQRIYGSDIVKLAIYPNDFANKRDITINSIVKFSDDKDMKAIIVNQAIPGTAEAFRIVKEKRPDIICIACESHESLSEIASVADLVCNNDFVSRGYLIIRTAHELGCDTFVHVSFPRHMAYESMSRRATIMKEACEELGMNFVMETAMDPTLNTRVTYAQDDMLEKVPKWVEKYGKKSAYFCTNDALTEPLIKKLLECGGYFIEADLPSPLMGYPGALGLNLTNDKGDFQKILSKVETAINEKGGAGRFGTWTYSYGYTQSAGLAQHALNVIKKESDLLDIDDIVKAYRVFTPKAAWNGSKYIDVNTGERINNVFSVYQDTYIMGKPGRYMGATQVKVPEKYFLIK